MKTRVAALALTFLLFGAFLPVAGANTITRTDGNDSPGPLDLASMRVTHAGTSHGFRMTTQDAFTNAEIDGDVGWFRVGFDLNADQTYDRNIFVFYASGRMRGVLTDKSLAVIDYGLWASRVSGNTVEVRLPMSKIGNPDNYDVAVWTVSRSSPCTEKDPCIDFIPNRYPLIRHDLTAPKVAWTDVPEVSTEVSATTTFPVSFVATDVGFGSGVKTWILWRAPLGTKHWTKVKAGTAAKATVRVEGTQGAMYAFKVEAVDRQGNMARLSGRTTSVPWDDAGASYGPTEVDWTGETGVGGAYLGTTHTSATLGATATFAFKADRGRQACVVGGPSDGPVEADMTLDSTTRARWLHENRLIDQRRIVGCMSVGTTGRHRVTITVPAATGFVVDGLVLVP